MQTYLATAAGVAFVTGVVHSMLGEHLIFRHLRSGTVVPGGAAPPLQSRNIRIIWATWHLATVFGWAFAVVMLRLALSPQAPAHALILDAMVAAYAGGSVLVLIATKGRHPGWIALALVAGLVWTAAVAVR